MGDNGPTDGQTAGKTTGEHDASCWQWMHKNGYFSRELYYQAPPYGYTPRIRQSNFTLKYEQNVT